MLERRLRTLLLLTPLLRNGIVQAFSITCTKHVRNEQLTFSQPRFLVRWQPPVCLGANSDGDFEGNAEEEPTKRNKFKRFGKSLSKRAVSSVNRMRGKNDAKLDKYSSLPIEESDVKEFSNGDSFRSHVDGVFEDGQSNSKRKSFFEGATFPLDNLRDQISNNIGNLSFSLRSEAKEEKMRKEQDEEDGKLASQKKLGNFAGYFNSPTSMYMDKLGGDRQQKMSVAAQPVIDDSNTMDWKAGLDINVQESIGRLPMNNEFAQIKNTLVERATSSTKEISNLYRYLDQKAKSSLSGITGDLGDMSYRIDSEIKEKINNFTGEDEYKVGDITKTIIRKVAKEEYNFADIILLCKILIKLGADFSPVATILPVRLLLEIFDYSIALELSDKFVKAISVELDKRLNNYETEDDDYAAGDMTRQAILEYTGKDDYSFGDITKRIFETDKSMTQQAEINDRNSLARSTAYSMAAPWKEYQSDASDAGTDVLNELEECLAMEKALIEKLRRLQSGQ